MDLYLYVKLLRPYQWIKNLLLFAPLFFSGEITFEAVIHVLYGILCFCIASSLGYIVNDWIDHINDSNHPHKKDRPIAAGSISIKKAFILWLILFFLLLFMLIAILPPVLFLIYIFLYLILSILYSIYFRNIIILDLFIISFGFVLRVLAGGSITGIEVSRWLFMSVFFLSMIISIAKRKSELLVLKEDALYHRKNLMKYRQDDLSKMLWIMAGISLVVYTIYCIDKKNDLIYSVIPATYGVLRFCVLAEQGKTLDPIGLFFRDVQLIIVTIIFLVFLSIKIYFS